MATWNYRVVKKLVNEETIFGIHEAFYDDDGNLEGITENPVQIYAEESVENLADEMKYIVAALEAEPIIYEEAPMMRMEPTEEEIVDLDKLRDEMCMDGMDNEPPPDIMDPPIDIINSQE